MRAAKMGTSKSRITGRFSRPKPPPPPERERESKREQDKERERKRARKRRRGEGKSIALYIKKPTSRYSNLVI